MELWIQHERHGEGCDHEAQQRGDHCLLYVVRVRVVNAAVAVHALPHLGGVPAGGVAAVARTTGAAGVGGAAGVAGSQVSLGDALWTPGAVDHRSAMQIFDIGIYLFFSEDLLLSLYSPRDHLLRVWGSVAVGACQGVSVPGVGRDAASAAADRATWRRGHAGGHLRSHGRRHGRYHGGGHGGDHGGC